MAGVCLCCFALGSRKSAVPLTCTPCSRWRPRKTFGSVRRTSRSSSGLPAAWLRLRRPEARCQPARDGRRAGGGIPVELLRAWQEREGDAERECAEPTPASDVDLANSEGHKGDRHHDAVGGAVGSSGRSAAACSLPLAGQGSSWHERSCWLVPGPRPLGHRRRSAAGRKVGCERAVPARAPGLESCLRPSVGADGP